MLAIMSFQKVQRLRVLKLLWLEGTWIQRNVPPLTSHSTKANNAKKPVRYTSIKKAKPKTISDIAKLLQQRSKETKERQQSMIFTSTTNTSKPAPPNQMNHQSEATATIISYEQAQTSAINLPIQDSSVSDIRLDSEPVQDIVDVKAAASITDSKTCVESRTTCETAPDTVLIDAAVDFSYSKHVEQMAMEGLHNGIYTDARDSAAKSVDSGVELTSVNATQQTSTQGDVTTNISQTFQTSDLISSHHDVVSASGKYPPEVVDESIYMPEVLKTSKVIVPEVLSTHENGQHNSFAVSQVVSISNASTIINFAQSQSTQSQDAHTPNWSSNIKLTSSQEIINQYCPKGTPDSIDICNAEAVAPASGDVPAFPEVCCEKAIPSSDPIPEISLFILAEDLPVCETTSVSPSETDSVSEVFAEAQSSINLKDPILVQTNILEEEKQTDSVEKLPEAQLDPIQRLFLHKLREYSMKSQAGGLVDAGPEYEKALSEEQNKLQRLYGGGDLTKFPEFNFSEPSLDESNSK